jgi:hypothetical protein
MPAYDRVVPRTLTEWGYANRLVGLAEIVGRTTATR